MMSSLSHSAFGAEGAGGAEGGTRKTLSLASLSIRAILQESADHPTEFIKDVIRTGIPINTILDALLMGNENSLESINNFLLLFRTIDEDLRQGEGQDQTQFLEALISHLYDNGHLSSILSKKDAYLISATYNGQTEIVRLLLPIF